MIMKYMKRKPYFDEMKNKKIIAVHNTLRYDQNFLVDNLNWVMTKRAEVLSKVDSTIERIQPIDGCTQHEPVRPIFTIQ